jgi:hypothetical protein
LAGRAKFSRAQFESVETLRFGLRARHTSL